MGRRKKTVIKKPKPIDPTESMSNYLFGKNFATKFKGGITDPKFQKMLLQSERRFRPQYTALELAEQQAALFGTKGQQGLIDMQIKAGKKLARADEKARERQIKREVKMLGSLGDNVVRALRKADPYSTELADLQSEQAQALFGEADILRDEAALFREQAKTLSPEMQREAEQQARMASLARGRIGDESSVASEILSREQFKRGLRDEARLATQLAGQSAQLAGQQGALGFSQARQIGGDPAQFLFGRPTQQSVMGGQLYGQATNVAGQPSGPQLFDPNMGVNLAMQQRSQDMNLLGAQMQADASRSAGRSGMFGSIIGGAFKAGMFCWVAREVYGARNPRWLQFRQWVIHKSPNWFFRLYAKYGERFAEFISNKPLIKKFIRKWMDTKIS